MANVDDRFDDALIDLVGKDRPRDSRGEQIPTWPQFPTQYVEPIPDATFPVQPLDEELIRANQYAGNAWDGGKTSYFRDMLLVAEQNARLHGLMSAQIEGRDWNPPLASLIPSWQEHLTGGVEGAIARSSEASMAVEKRLREVRSRKREDWRYSYQELRASNITTTSGGVGLVPVNGAPRYVADAFADQARTKARLAYRLFQGQLPPSGNIVLVPRATTGVVMAVQSSENTAITDTAAVTDTASSPVITITGMQQVSRQLFDQGINTDVDIAASLGASFGQILEQQVLNGSGASGQLTGLLGVSGITSNAYTDATATAAEAFGAIEKLLSDTGTAYGAPVDTLVMHSRRARWMNDNTTFATPRYGAEVLETQGVPTNLGAGTNEDAVVALQLSETPIYIGPVNFAVYPDVLSNTLQVRIIAWAYVAMVGARLPASIGKLGGTGFIAPTFP